MKKLNLRIPALLLVVIMIMAFAVPVFAANSSDAAAAETTEAVESAGGLSATSAKALGAAIAIGLAAAGGAIAMGVVAGKSAEPDPHDPDAEPCVHRDCNHLCAAGCHSDHLRTLKAGAHREYPT